MGSWLLKCKQRGVVMHNSDLVLDGLVHIDAELQFKALSHFSTSLNGVLTFEDSLSKGIISKSGDIRPIRTLYHALSNLKGDDIIAAMDDDEGVDRGGAMSDSGDSDSGDSEGEDEGEGFSGDFGVGAGADFPSSSGAGSGSATSSPARTPTHTRRARRTPGNYTPGGENCSTESRAVPNSRDRLIKAGWLYKQGDLLRRWRCRYFKVYPMRVEYFADQYDTKPRGVYILTGAHIRPARQCQVNGIKDHWMVQCELKDRTQVFKVASEKTGDEGEVDASTWVQVFQMAMGSELQLQSMNSHSTPQSQAGEITPPPHIIAEAVTGSRRGHRRNSSGLSSVTSDEPGGEVAADADDRQGRGRRKRGAPRGDVPGGDSHTGTGTGTAAELDSNVEGYVLIARGATASMLAMNMLNGNVFIPSTVIALVIFSLSFLFSQPTTAKA